MIDVIIVSTIIIVALILFATERIRVDLVAALIMATLMVIGLIRPNFLDYGDAVSGFSNKATVTVAAMFILSAGLLKSGAINLISGRLLRYGAHGEKKLFLVLMATAGVVSAFINNTAAVAVFLPVTLTISKSYQISPSKLLIPLSFVSIVGGTCTLIGTSTNILVSSMAADAGIGGFGMFELTKLGAVFFFVGLIYLFFFARVLLPDRVQNQKLTKKYRMGNYLTALVINEGSPLVNNTPAESRVNSKYDVTILEIIRNDKHIWSGLRDAKLQIGDILLVRGTIDGFMAMKNAEGVTIRSQERFADKELDSDDSVLSEGVIAPSSPLVGKTLKEANFRHIYNVFALAIRKHGETLHNKIGHIRLEVGDALLLQGQKRAMESLSGSSLFLMMQEVNFPIIRKEKALVAILITAGVVLTAALGIMPILVSAIVGCLLLVLSGCVTVQEAYDSIDWFVIFLLAGVIPLGLVMENTGTAAWLSAQLLSITEQFGPVVILSAFYLIVTIFTSIMSNNAAAVVFVPIGIATAQKLGLNPTPFLMAITFAASASLSTPFGYHTNLMVYGPGGYKFMDYIKVGVPLNLLFWILATLLIPVFWPLQ